jgi:hypothetical protein
VQNIHTYLLTIAEEESVGIQTRTAPLMLIILFQRAVLSYFPSTFAEKAGVQIPRGK